MKETLKTLLIGLLAVLFIASSCLSVWLFMVNSSQKRQISAQQQRLDDNEAELKKALKKVSSLEEELEHLNGGQASSYTIPATGTAKKESDVDKTSGDSTKKETQSQKKKQETANLSDLENAKTQALVDSKQIDYNNLNNYFKSYAISDALFDKIYGDNKSYKTYCTVPRESLRYIKVIHYDYNGYIRVGELIANAAIEEDLLYIFKTLFENKYQIEKMILVEKYGADDDTSVNDNNTSCFNFRYATDSNVLSNHATGCAIDINPLQNPYFRILEDGSFDYDNVDADKYWDRDNDPVNRHMITHSDLCYQLFAERGFTWGGDWGNPIDYQHFEKLV